MTDLQIFCRSFVRSHIFQQRAHSAFARLTKEEILKRPRDVKVLLEEILPLATMAQYFCVPGRLVRCRHQPDTLNNFDGWIRFEGDEVASGIFKPEYFVEITSVLSPDDHLVREELLARGASFPGGDFKKTGKRGEPNRSVRSCAVARDVYDEIAQVREAVRAAIERKSSKPYPSPALLLVSVSRRRLGFEEWLIVSKAVSDLVADSAFQAVYLLNPWSNDVICCGGARPGVLTLDVPTEESQRLPSP